MQFFFCVYILCIALFYILSTLLIDATISEFSDIYLSISLFVRQCFAVVRLKKMQLLKSLLNVYKLITFRNMLKNLNLNYVMISSFTVALTDKEFHPQLIKEPSHFVLKASGKIFFDHF